MIESSVMVDVLIRERERELRALALRRAALHAVDSDRRALLRRRRSERRSGGDVRHLGPPADNESRRAMSFVARDDGSGA